MVSAVACGSDLEHTPAVEVSAGAGGLSVIPSAGAGGARLGVSAAMAAGAGAVGGLPSGAGAVSGAGTGAMSMSSAAAGSLAPAPASAAAPVLPPAPSAPKAVWTRCGSYECASLDVPLNYAAPGGETIRLALQRRRATGTRSGAMLINPGGPGASAIEFLRRFTAGAGAALSEHFDIVAFDPRGVGASAPLDCHSTLQQLIAKDPSPDDEAEWAAINAAAAKFADECAGKHPALLPHLSTREVARDMDLVRAALGEERINYFGYSYGTALGARYADLFPERVQRFVLDGALDMKLSALEIAEQQAVGFERALAAYFSFCAGASGNCSWAGAARPADAFLQLSASIDQRPIAAARGDRPLGPGEFLLGVIAPLYGGTQGYRSLSMGLVAAKNGDGTALLSLTDSYLTRKQDGSYGNIQEANNAVNCLDLPAPDLAALRAQAPKFMAAAPYFGLPTLTGLSVCAHWAAPGQKLPPPRAAGAAPIVVIGTTGDPATPYAWSEALASELESAVLLTYEGEGHTAYGRGVTCIDDAVEAYFLDGKVPADGTRCARAEARASMIELRGL